MKTLDKASVASVIQFLETSAKKMTPGPWIGLDLRQEFLDDNGLPSETEQTLSICAEGGVVARIKNEVSKKPLDENDEANANMIASIPLMLDLIRFLLKERDSGVIVDRNHFQECVDILSKSESPTERQALEQLMNTIR